MSGIVFRGNLEGGSTLLTDDLYCGEVWHSIRVYQDTLRNIMVAVGKIWGDDLVLQYAATGRDVKLRLEDGRVVRVIVQRKSADNKYISVGVDGPIPDL